MQFDAHKSGVTHIVLKVNVNHHGMIVVAAYGR